MKREQFPHVDEAIAIAVTTESSPSHGLQFLCDDASISAVTVPSQRDRRSMNRRPGQRGAVYVVGEKYVGRYRVDVRGQIKRNSLLVEIGNIHEITRPQAERWLARFIERQGVKSHSRITAR